MTIKTHKTEWETYSELDGIELKVFKHPNDMWMATVADFVDSIRKGSPPLATGEDGRASLELIMASYESFRTGKKVSLPLKKKTNPIFEIFEQGLL